MKINIPQPEMRNPLLYEKPKSKTSINMAKTDSDSSPSNVIENERKFYFILIIIAFIVQIFLNIISCIINIKNSHYCDLQKEYYYIDIIFGSIFLLITMIVLGYFHVFRDNKFFCWLSVSLFYIFEAYFMGTITCKANTESALLTNVCLFFSIISILLYFILIMKRKIILKYVLPLLIIANIISFIINYYLIKEFYFSVGIGLSLEGVIFGLFFVWLINEYSNNQRYKRLDLEQDKILFIIVFQTDMVFINIFAIIFLF